MNKYSMIFILILTVMLGCEKDETMMVLKSEPVSAKLTGLDNGMTTVITQDKLADEIEFSWVEADYGVNTEVKYTVEVEASCNSFATPVVIGTTNSNSLKLSLQNLNSRLVNDLKAAPHKNMDVQIRVTATIMNKYLTVSDVKSVSITPYSDRPVALWLGEKSATAPQVFETSAGKFEGYRFLNEGTFLFSDSPVCADMTLGESGTPGVLAEGSASEVNVTAAGYYKINVNTETLEYSKTLITTWGIIGTATPGSWDNSTPMTYNEDQDVWETQVNLSSGALKFRANNGWDINYGPADINALEGTLIQTNDAINIAEAGNYKVTIDFSQAKSPYAYTYTVVKSGNVPEPAKLWLPGGYQNWSPATAPTIYAVSNGVYEGYIYINAGTGFKFTNSPDWDHINYGDSGTPGLLTTDGLANGLSINAAGYYKLKANTQTLAYEITLVNTWGMVGTATPGAWDVSSPLTYDAANDVWKATINLVAGALKFRANNGWDLNYGPASITALNGTLIQTNDAINIAEPGSYTITLDFSRSEAPFQYIYTVVKN